ncbi:non-specific lipid transfer protein GPI-anchored 25 [Hordeum vulgare subsp. vulgare]|uniref:Predicted protein n=1 Tax=Hordeum vulgare subsp. vulgare TaxID=112509 RepID=F2D569_HORVV|nr:non-specific lipid transfer protein GPI-anchored 25 [Hordeum vulgare subsp. vulgare]KAI5000857.1 hypothetical protein ZWY2020_010816 [Hordeum vulgare]BAJ90240.1 predicted protein [Hordeum vulgare subsp. vulgare]
MAPPALLLLVLAVTALHAHAASAALSQEPPATPCAAAIVSFSPCLAHVAVVAPPALPSSAPTSACCAAFLRAVSSGDGEGAGGGEGCFCHLLRDPLLLGFPVDAARLGALLPTCASAKTSAATAVEAEALFADKCRELKSLPEMHFTPPSPPPAPKLSPAAVPEPAFPAPKMEEHSSSTPAPGDRSGSDAVCACRVFLVALVLGAAVLITLNF